MATHGTIAIRRKIEESDEVFVFHVNRNGYMVEKFMEKNSDPKSIDNLIIDAVRFVGNFSDGGYNDIMSVNVYSEEFNPEREYQDMTEYSVYFTGDEWKYDFSYEEDDN